MLNLFCKCNDIDMVNEKMIAKQRYISRFDTLILRIENMNFGSIYLESWN